MTTTESKHKSEAKTQADTDDAQVVAPEDDTDAVSSEPAGETDQDSDDTADTPDSEAVDTPDDVEDDTPSGRRNREAGLRRRAQTAEAERDALREQLITLQRGIVDQMCERVQMDPRLLKAAGFELPDLCDDDGNLDRQKVAEAVAATTKEFRRRPQPNAQQGQYSVFGPRAQLKDTLNTALGRNESVSKTLRG